MNLRYLYLLVIVCGMIQTGFAQTKEIPRDTSYNIGAVYRQIHRDFPKAVPVKDSLPKGVKAERNLVYTTLTTAEYGKRDLHLDIFQPQKAGKYPAIIMIHGGGWRSGTKEMQVPLAQILATKGIVTIPVEYQLSMEAKYPAAVYNIKAAVRWVRANAERYNIDTAKIAISGCSAGGQLASLVGLTNGIGSFEGEQGNAGTSSAVSAIIDIDGVIDFMAPASLNLNRKADSPDIIWLGGSFEDKPLIWKEASPIFWAQPTTTPPILFLNSGYSRFHAGQDELIGMMKEWKVYAEVHVFNFKVHPFWLFYPWVDTTANYMADFLKKVYKIK